MDIRPAHTTVFDLDVDIVVTKLLWLEIDQLQLIPMFGIMDAIANDINDSSLFAHMIFLALTRSLSIVYPSENSRWTCRKQYLIGEL